MRSKEDVEVNEVTKGNEHCILPQHFEKFFYQWKAAEKSHKKPLFSSFVSKSFVST